MLRLRRTAKLSNMPHQEGQKNICQSEITNQCCQSEYTNTVTVDLQTNTVVDANSATVEIKSMPQYKFNQFILSTSQKNNVLLP